jgi:hypothetical protein
MSMKVTGNCPETIHLDVPALSGSSFWLPETTIKTQTRGCADPPVQICAGTKTGGIPRGEKARNPVYARRRNAVNARKPCRGKNNR